MPAIPTLAAATRGHWRDLDGVGLKEAHDREPPATHLPASEPRRRRRLSRLKLSTALRVVPDDASVPMTGGAHTLERDEPVAKPEYSHHDSPDRLSHHRCDAFGTDGLIGLSEQPDYGVARFLQSAGPPARRTCLFGANAGKTPEVDFLTSWHQPEPRGWASCPTRRRKATGHSALAVPHSSSPPARESDPVPSSRFSLADCRSPYRQISKDWPTSAARYRSSGTGYHVPSWARTQ